LRKKETGVENTDIHQKGIIKFCLDVALLFLEVLTKKMKNISVYQMN